MPLRIAAVAYTHYDSDPRVRREAEALAARGDHVTVWALEQEGLPKERDLNGVRVIGVPMPRYRGGRAVSYIGSYLRFFVEAGVRVSAAHARQPFDIVHAHTMPDFIVFVALLPRLSGAKVVLDMHDLMPDLFALKFVAGSGGAEAARSALPRRIVVSALKGAQSAATTFADTVIAVHRNQYDLLLRDGVPARKLAIVMNAADPALFPPRKQEPKPGPEGEIRLLYHGTVLHRYGVDIAVRAFARALREEPRVRLSILGGGDYVEELRRLAGELGLGAPQLEMSGAHLPLEQIAARVQDTHIGVVPNRDDNEDSVLPTKLLECLQVGVPAIATRTRAIDRFFHGDQVELVALDDVEGMAAAMVRLARDGKRRAALTKAGLGWQEEYGWEVQKNLLFRIFDGLTYEKVQAQKRQAQAEKDGKKTGTVQTPPKAPPKAPAGPKASVATDPS